MVTQPMPSTDFERLLSELGSSDKELHNEAITQASCLLEKTNRNTNETYESLLPKHLLTVKLTKEEQRQIVELIISLIGSERADISRLSLFYALGKASPQVGLKPLIRLLSAHYNDYNAETLLQALFALHHFLLDTETPPPAKFKKWMRQYNLLPLLSQTNPQANNVANWVKEGLAQQITYITENLTSNYLDE